MGNEHGKTTESKIIVIYKKGLYFAKEKTKNKMKLLINKNICF